MRAFENNCYTYIVNFYLLFPDFPLVFTFTSFLGSTFLVLFLKVFGVDVEVESFLDVLLVITSTVGVLVVDFLVLPLATDFFVDFADVVLEGLDKNGVFPLKSNPSFFNAKSTFSELSEFFVA